MDRIKSRVYKTLRKGFVQNLHKNYNINLELSDRDLWYLEYGDPSGIHTGAVLDKLYKHFPEILDYRNDDVTDIVRCIIRLQCLRKDSDAMMKFISSASKCTSSMEFHAFLQTIDSINMDATVCDVMNVVDLRDPIHSNINLLTCAMKDTKALDRFKYLSIIHEHALRTSSIIFRQRIPTNMYTASINYLYRCTKLAEVVPECAFMRGFNEIMNVKDMSSTVVEMRTVILESLKNADLLNSDNVEKVLYHNYHIESGKRSFKCMKSGNAAYTLLELLSRYKLLTPVIFYSISESINRIANGAIMDFPEIVDRKIPPHILNPIIAEIESSRLYDLAIDAKIDILEDVSFQ